MSTLRTEWLVNKIRYFFTIFFMISACLSWLKNSHPTTWGAILGTSAVFLMLAIINQIFINREKIVPAVIYGSVTVEISLIFALKFSMHFNPAVGWGLSLKEPATFIVYFLFMVMTALRYNKRLTVYAGTISVLSYIILLILGITLGGLRFTDDAAEFFSIDTLRVATEASKILFLIAFTFFLYKMAEYTSDNLVQLENARKKSNDNFLHMKKILNTVEQTAEDLLEGSRELSDFSDSIDTIVSENNTLLDGASTISDAISGSIEEVSQKSQLQAKTVTENFSVITEISELMENIYTDSNAQTQSSERALQLANTNEQHINDTRKSIIEMKENSKRIEEIFQTISEIADQTSLLSLNAAIESARAGEHGRGFAVVADEISKLASKSIDSSKEISVIISDTVQNIDRVSQMITSLSGYLEQNISLVKENSTFMTNLNSNTSREYEASKMLYSSTKEVAEATQSVIQQAKIQDENLGKISDWMTTFRTTSSEISTKLKDLQLLSNKMKDSSVNMKEIIENQEEKEVSDEL